MGTALVIGGSRGIGRGIALKLANSGFDIWLTYHSNSAAAEEVQKEIEAQGRTCEIMGFDVSDFEATKAALADKCDQDPPEVMVFNSGIIRDNLMVWMTKDEWDAVIDTNLSGFYNVTKAVLFPMLREKRGRIVVISSTAGQIGQAGQVNYSASKAGLIGAVKALAREVGKKNVFVNVVAPGVIETDMTADLPEKQIKPLIPLNKFGVVEDVAATVDFLCSDAQSYIHGQVIGVNGGLAI
ncbi:3-oxoacyl-[acyl-carrier-protein] reductase FabG [Pontiella desulfatans]|uniref:3-oxoacyl-[acyl-carrier-protein] reductase FabG n=1 Tax=Pontiella desulfatans TaxID=2750659 RepID=A0A6C2U4X8_PONDE|nr:3-oxoacyl-ACP reductase FabG [Pontiella desulfatans]VGO14564.1 3-oxoacyl-[acyl-carrier-protein] reductase FabG [Pontiella desulfatans]